MNIDNFCNLGAALQNKQIEVGKQPQIYFYRSNEDSIYEMLSEGYFNALNLRVAKDDLILLYSPRDERKVFAKVVSNSGGIVQIIEMFEDVFQHDEMPIPSIEYLNKIVQYIGNTTSEYTNGFFYRCIQRETYTGNVSFDRIISCSNEDFINFLESKFENIEQITHGTMTYSSLGNIWRFVGKNSSDETIATYQQYTGDFEEEGFVFTGTYQDGDIVNFTCNITETISYEWENIIVQDSYLKSESDDRFVHKTGDETIDGNKTLTGITTINNADIGSTDTDTLTVNTSATIPAPTTDNNPATKKYVDDAVSGLTNFADKDLSNLTSQGKNIANWSSNISNCITEIPQDIKISLSNNTITLVNGSKAYFADGTSITITSDKTLINTGSAQMYLHIQKSSSSLYAGYMTGGTVSERPVNPINYASYYNTSTQKCEYYDGSTWNEISLPIAIVTRSSLGFKSIDQVFNGFGYIGSTIFALPGVKGLIPNGRNADGSLKSVEFTVNNVIAHTQSYWSGYEKLYLSNNNFYISGNVAYDEKENRLSVGGVCKAGNIYLDSSFIIKIIQPKTPFRAVDYNDTEFIGHQAMPSDRYIDLTLGANGTSYTAPANGYFCLNGKDSDNTGTEDVVLRNQTRAFGVTITKNSVLSSAWIGCILPTKKGDIAYLYYRGTLLVNDTNFYWRFYYAEGEV